MLCKCCVLIFLLVLFFNANVFPLSIIMIVRKYHKVDDMKYNLIDRLLERKNILIIFAKYNITATKRNR